MNKRVRVPSSPPPPVGDLLRVPTAVVMHMTTFLTLDDLGDWDGVCKATRIERLWTTHIELHHFPSPRQLHWLRTARRDVPLSLNAKIAHHVRPLVSCTRSVAHMRALVEDALSGATVESHEADWLPTTQFVPRVTTLRLGLWFLREPPQQQQPDNADRRDIVHLLSQLPNEMRTLDLLDAGGTREIVGLPLAVRSQYAHWAPTLTSLRLDCEWWGQANPLEVIAANLPNLRDLALVSPAIHTLPGTGLDRLETLELRSTHRTRDLPLVFQLASLHRLTRLRRLQLAHYVVDWAPFCAFARAQPQLTHVSIRPHVRNDTTLPSRLTDQMVLGAVRECWLQADCIDVQAERNVFDFGNGSARHEIADAKLAPFLATHTRLEFVAWPHVLGAASTAALLAGGHPWRTLRLQDDRQLSLAPACLVGMAQLQTLDLVRQNLDLTRHDDDAGARCVADLDTAFQRITRTRSYVDISVSRCSLGDASVYRMATICASSLQRLTLEKCSDNDGVLISLGALRHLLEHARSLKAVVITPIKGAPFAADLGRELIDLTASLGAHPAMASCTLLLRAHVSAPSLAAFLDHAQPMFGGPRTTFHWLLSKTKRV